MASGLLNDARTMLPPTYYDPTVMNVSVAAANQAGPDPSTNHAWKNGSFSFHDVLDTLNPLQHIPIIDTLYRWVTGDQPGNVARIVGDGIYGGPIGLGVGMLSAAFEAETGKDPGQAVIAAITGADDAKVTLGAAAAQPAGSAPPTTAATPAAAPASAAVPPFAAMPPAVTGATGPMPMPTAAQPPSIVSGPPHPFIPLYRSPPTLTPATIPANPATSAANASEQAFMAQSAAYQRSLYGQRAAGTQQTAPIPLQLTGPQLPFVPVRPAASAAAAPSVTPAPVAATTPSSVTAPASTAAPAAAGALPQTVPPADIPQRMMDALDKYQRMQQQTQQRGQQLDMAP